MALLDDVRMAIRVSPVPVDDENGAKPFSDGWVETYASDYDDEIQDLVDAALADLARVGVMPHLLDPEDPDPLVKMAVKLYAKAHFGYDNDESDRLMESYERTVVDLMNSAANIACWAMGIEDCDVSEIPPQTWAGRRVRPVPEVFLDDYELVRGEDFVVSYSGNDGIGTAEAHVRGTGSFKGSVTVPFEIVEA